MSKNTPFTLYEKLRYTNEGNVKLLSVLYNSFRNVLLVQSTQFKDRNEQVLGISNAQIFVASKKCDKYTPNIEAVNDYVKIMLNDN